MNDRPIPMYASMATTRLMAVMLADATRVMARRAQEQEEMELPLYDEDLVARIVQRFRPVPASGSFGPRAAAGVRAHGSRRARRRPGVGRSWVAGTRKVDLSEHAAGAD